MTILTVFRSRLKAGVEDVYNALAEEASVLARQTLGFVEEKTFTAADGEQVTIGRTQLYSEYRVYTAEVDYSQSFAVDALS